MFINHNMAAINAHNHWFSNNLALNESLERLASGLKINRAADNAAGFAISEKMRSQIRGLNQAGKNAQDGISMLQTAEGAMVEVHEVLQRMRELSVKAASDTCTVEDRLQIQKEIDQLISEVDRIANTTNFNELNLLDGTTTAVASTDNILTRVFMQGELESMNLFGQKISAEGNYRLNVTTTPGVNQVLKTNIFTLMPDGDVVKTLDGVQTVVDTMTIHQAGEAQTSGAIVAGSQAKLRDVVNFRDADGNFILENGKTITLVQGDGTKASFTLYGDDTLADMARKINDAIAYGLGQVDIVGEENLNRFVNCPTLTSPSDLTAIEKIIYGLKNGWLEAAEERIKQYYGLEGTGLDLGVNIYDKAEYGILACITYQLDGLGNSSNHQLYMDINDFQPADFPNGDNIHAPGMYGDRIIAHEMVHAIMSVNMSNSAASTWFKEGAAELIHGRNEQLKIDMDYNGATSNVNTAAAAIMTDLGNAWTGSNEDYSAAYVAVRYLDSIATGGIAAVMSQLKGGSTLSDAIAATTAYANETAFLADVSGAGGAAYLAGLYAGLDDDLDTGAIGGKDVSGGAIITAEDVINEALANDTSDGQPLSAWNVVWPVNTSSPGPNPSFDPLYVDPGMLDNANTILEAVNGTYVIRSAMAGKEGELTFIADQDVLNALGLVTIQEAVDNRFNVDVFDAHDGTIIAQDIKLSENKLIGVIHKNVDVQFASNTGVKIVWDGGTENFIFTGGTGNAEELFVHIANRTAKLQLGANRQQDMAASIANLTASALGIDKLLVVSRSHATRAISSIDRAINRVSKERSKIGAIQDRLDHAGLYLSVWAENLTSAESKIRDTDMAKEAMIYAKNTIIANSVSAMMAQANQNPRMILQLL